MLIVQAYSQLKWEAFHQYREIHGDFAVTAHVEVGDNPRGIVLSPDGNFCGEALEEGASDVLCRPLPETLIPGAVALVY